MISTQDLFADRMSGIPESFIREILKVAASQHVISFAGGLPNPSLFPAEKLAIAAEKVLRKDGRSALQYAPTEGYLPLRDFLAQRQSLKEGITILPEQILMLNGSQQGLDLCGKLFCNKHEPILLEEPSYLGAIQAFSAYEPTFHTVRLLHDGPDQIDFDYVARKVKPKFFYAIPNFQNPTGYSYSRAKRISLAESQSGSPMLWIEDNPYGEIFFSDHDRPDFHSLIPEKTIQLGSFSKIMSPGMRLGWASGPLPLIRKMAIAKQASDLHTNNLSQRIAYQFLCDNDLDDHLNAIRKFYRQQCERMVSFIKQFFPANIDIVKPEGGMFLWITLPEHINATAFLDKALRKDVIFVPGSNFFVHPEKGTNTLRLNFSNPSEEEMKKGLFILGEILLEEMGG